jgi:hypothetical protein
VASHLHDFLDRRVTDGVNYIIRERNSSMKNRKRETCTSGSVRDEGGNILIYSAAAWDAASGRTLRVSRQICRLLRPVAFVIDANIHRRDLDEIQRATVAAKLSNMRQGQRTDLEPSANLPKVGQADAAKMLNVSTRTVASASAVRSAGTPEIGARRRAVSW